MGVMDTLKAILTRSVLKSNQWQTIRLMLREIQVIDIYRATKTTTGPYIDPLIWFKTVSLQVHFWKSRTSCCVQVWNLHNFIPDTIIKQSRQHEGGPVLLVPGPHHPLSRLRGDLHTGHQGVPGVAVLLSECIPLPRQVYLVSNEAYNIITIISCE